MTDSPKYEKNKKCPICGEKLINSCNYDHEHFQGYYFDYWLGTCPKCKKDWLWEDCFKYEDSTFSPCEEE